MILGGYVFYFHMHIYFKRIQTKKVKTELVQHSIFIFINCQTIFNKIIIIIIVSEKEQEEENAYHFPPLTQLLMVCSIISAIILKENVHSYIHL